MARHLSSREYAASKRLANRLHVPHRELLWILQCDRGISDFYFVEEKPKPHGGVRVLHKPYKLLKVIQRAIYELILLPNLRISNIAHGYMPGRSIYTNALAHRESHSLYALDLVEAFPSTDMRRAWQLEDREMRNRIMRYLGLKGAEIDLIIYLTHVNTGRGRYGLPQGAPTSPILLNHALKAMDKELEWMVNNDDLTITRYSDNIFASLKGRTFPNCLRRELRHQVGKFREFHEDEIMYIRNGNELGRPLRFLGVNIMDGELYLPPDKIDEYRQELFRAGLEGDLQARAGIWSVVKPIYDGWPARLVGQYRKGMMSRQSWPEQLTLDRLFE